VSALRDLITAEISEAVDPRVSAMAAAIAAKHGGACRAVLFYGSCLRESQLDGLMLDFYLIVSDYSAAYPKRWLATANRLIPPNVFPFVHDGLTAKYAVLSEADFAHLNAIEASTVSVWARFAQPVRLVWTASPDILAPITESLATAPRTLLALAAPMTASQDPLEQWRTGFGLTYGCELRAERADRSGSIVDADPERYAAVSAAIAGDFQTLARSEADRRWERLRRNGKMMSVLRLAKASLTFAGGIDYLAWKINRHAGTKIEIKPWQRRWPLLGAIVLVPRLLMQGAVR
jgi:hypothetical protein